ncbi:MAG: hypothetical protein FK734_11575 [Asgard group archaeon]|nr:hypothetical protein [Asgard group archaeon]
MLKITKSALIFNILITTLFIGNIIFSTNTISINPSIGFVDKNDSFTVQNSDGLNNELDINSIFDTNPKEKELNLDIDIIGGYGWEEPEVIFENSPLNDLKIAVDGDDNVHLLWSGRYDDDWVLYHRVKFHSNDTWSSTENLGYTTEDYHGLMDVKTDSNGIIHLVYNSRGMLYYRYYENYHWSNPIFIAAGQEPRLKLSPDGTPAIAYYSVFNNYYVQFYFSKFYEVFGSWSHEIIPYQTVSYSNTVTNYNFIIVNESGVERTYYSTGSLMRNRYFDNTIPGYVTVYYVQYYVFWKENETTDFSWQGYENQVPLDSNYYYLPKPEMYNTADQKVHMINFVPTSTSTSKIILQSKTISGWTTPQQFSTNAAINCILDLEIDNQGNVLYLWNNIRYLSGSTVADLYFRKYIEDQGIYTDEVVLNPDPNYAQYPDMCVDSDGNIHMVWLDQDGNNRRLTYRKGWCDSDQDGLMNIEEENIYFTDPYDADTDDDQLIDGDEILYGFDPFNWDEDNDSMADGYEFHYELDYTIDDSMLDFDNDSLTNIEEFLLGSYPNNPDSDGDLLNDSIEVTFYFTNPIKKDSDNDKLSDGLEVLTIGTSPLSYDTDNDTMNDWWEYYYELDPLVNDTTLDFDSDGLINILELQYHTLPNNPNTDDDGLLDGDEVYIWFTDPFVKDTDKDGLEDGVECLSYHTNPLKIDSDDDLLTDYAEVKIYNTDPNNNDSDSDLISDKYEVIYNDCMDPNDPSDAYLDFDGDTLNNYQEYLLWTNPNKVDTDGDKFTDPEELILGCNPALADTDGDGVNDYEEIIYLKTNVTNPDTDGDGLMDGLEVHVYFSDPHVVDSDGDGIIDGEEVYTYGSSPAMKDTDGEGLDDNIEIDFHSNPAVIDTDSDGMDDYFEWRYNLDPNFDDSHDDIDGDGIINVDEFINKANPLVIDSDLDGLSDYEEIVIWFTLAYKIDTDSDGLSDFEEVNLGEDERITSPHDPDTDDDRLTDGEELLLGTDPTKFDTDLDGVSDGEEVTSGTDPLNPAENIFKQRTRLIIITFSSIIGGILVYIFAPNFVSMITRDEEIKWVRQGMKWRQEKSQKIVYSSNNNHSGNDEIKQ